MSRIAGIVIAAIGLVLSVISILGVLPGLTSTGVMLIILGGVIIGLSFIPGPEAEDPARESTPSTLVNIFFSPSEVFESLRRHPRWLAALLIMSVLSAVYTNLFMYRVGAERVANYAIDKTLEMSFINEQARAQIEKGRQEAIEQAKDPVIRAGQAVSSFAWSVIGYAFLAAIFLLFILAMGGRINFWQAFSAVIYAAFPVAVLRFVLNSVILFLKDPVEIHPIRGQSSLIQDNLSFLVTPSDNPVIYTLLASLSLLSLYWVWMNATGLRYAGEQVSSSTAWTATLVVYGAMIVLGMAAAFAFPSFIS